MSLEYLKEEPTCLYGAEKGGLLRGVQGGNKGIIARDSLTLGNRKRFVLVQSIAGAQGRQPPNIPQ